MINTDPNARCLIFNNLPYELECVILNYYKELRDNAWHNTLRMFSTHKIMRELYKQLQNQDHHSDAFGYSQPKAYKREIFRLYKSYLSDYEGTINSEQMFDDTEGHAMINLGLLLNDNIDDRIMRVNYVSPTDIICALNDYLPFNSEAVQDIFDQKFICYWMNCGINKKETIIHQYFSVIKDDCLRNYGMVNVDNLGRNVTESAYRILRFAFINDSEWFK